MKIKEIESRFGTSNPAMMTFSEYYSLVNPGKEHHDSSAYQISLDKMNDIYHESKFPRLVQNLTCCGIRFELREAIVDLHEANYVSHDEDGEIRRNAQGMAILMTAEEKAIAIPERYRVEHAIVNAKTREVVAYTDDEWGCRLISVAMEYQGLGLGHIIKMESIKHHPFGHTGGTTVGGDNMIYRCYQELVSKALSRGEYRHAHQEGRLTMAKIDSILESACVSRRVFERQPEEMRQYVKQYSPARRADKIELNVDDISKMSIHIDSNFAIIYSTKLFELLKKRDQYEMFIEKGVKGYIYIGGVYDNNSTPKLHRIHAENPQTKLLLIELMLNKAKEEDGKIRMSKDDVLFCKKHLGDNFKFKKDKYDSMFEVEIKQPSMSNLKEVSFIERKLRLALDSFDEGWNQIQEIANSLADDAFDKEIARKAENDLGIRI